MAKQAKEVKRFEFSKVGTILDNIAKSIPIQIEKEIKEKQFITTGVYLLDAALSGKLLGCIQFGPSTICHSHLTLLECFVLIYCSSL